MVLIGQQRRLNESCDLKGVTHICLQLGQHAVSTLCLEKCSLYKWNAQWWMYLQKGASVYGALFRWCAKAIRCYHLYACACPHIQYCLCCTLTKCLPDFHILGLLYRLCWFSALAFTMFSYQAIGQLIAEGMGVRDYWIRSCLEKAMITGKEQCEPYRINALYWRAGDILGFFSRSLALLSVFRYE